jgi:hypothetical protein
MVVTLSAIGLLAVAITFGRMPTRAGFDLNSLGSQIKMIFVTPKFFL